jgi:hypothetical protein
VLATADDALRQRLVDLLNEVVDEDGYRVRQVSTGTGG